jgi:hypothetical protein
MPVSAARAKRRYTTRFLRIGDIPALLDLERRQWTAEQSATADDFRARIDAHPDLCVGAWCVRTGELLASVFCKPTTEAQWLRPGDWAESARSPAGVSNAESTLTSTPTPTHTRCLFGISLTSIDADAALQLVAFNYLYGIRRGVEMVFLGSPMPGLKRYLDRHPGACVEAYARRTRAGLPLDPQLRYYHAKGWRQLVSIRENYFPHEASLNYGAILKTRLDFVWLRPLLRLVPVSMLVALAALAPRWAIPDARRPVNGPATPA